MAGESATALQADRNKPELGSPITRLDMHMDRLCPITRVEEEPIWPDSKERRRRSSLPLANDLAVQRRRVAPPAAMMGWTPPSAARSCHTRHSQYAFGRRSPHVDDDRS